MILWTKSHFISSNLTVVSNLKIFLLLFFHRGADKQILWGCFFLCFILFLHESMLLELTEIISFIDRILFNQTVVFLYEKNSIDCFSPIALGTSDACKVLVYYTISIVLHKFCYYWITSLATEPSIVLLESFMKFPLIILTFNENFLSLLCYTELSCNIFVKGTVCKGKDLFSLYTLFHWIQ